jgi:hypothetical protein
LGGSETGYPPFKSRSVISSTPTFVSSKVTVTVKDGGFRSYFNNPSIPPRIDLILPCESPQPPLGRLGTLNSTFFSAAEKTLVGANHIKRPAITPEIIKYLNLIQTSRINVKIVHSFKNNSCCSEPKKKAPKILSS